VIPGLVTTIIPVHNRPILLAEAVESVLNQTYRPIEIIIIDDGSTDETPAVVDQFAEQHPNIVRAIHQKNAGSGLAREVGRKIARGEFIQYLDSDDILLPRKFELQVSGLRAHPETDVSYGMTRFYLKGNSPENKPWRQTGERIETMFPSFLKERCWGTSTPLYRWKIIDRAGPWLSMINEEDWEYDCRIASLGIRLHYVSEFVSEQRDHSGERLGRWDNKNKVKLQHRALAHLFIYSHALFAGLNHEYQEMQHFARELFFLSRQCFAAGLGEEGKQLFEVARTASGNKQGASLDFRLYSLMSRSFGWNRIGKIACYLDRFRRFMLV
jgi:glycosyltransferase involved in cell wall biosynthesis